MNFSNLKAFGASIGNSIQDLENSLAAATSPTSPPPSSSRPARISTSSPRPSLEQRPSSPATATATSPGGTHVSASSVADSFRERLRKQRASLDVKRDSPQRSTSSDSQRKVEQPVKEEQEPTPVPAVPEPPAPAKEDKPQPDTPTPAAVVVPVEQPPATVQQPKEEEPPAAVEEEEEDGWGIEDTTEPAEAEAEESPAPTVVDPPTAGDASSTSLPIIEDTTAPTPTVEEPTIDPLGATTSSPLDATLSPPAPSPTTDPLPNTDTLLDEPETEPLEIPATLVDPPAEQLEGEEAVPPIVLLDEAPTAAAEGEEEEGEQVVEPAMELTEEPEEIPAAEVEKEESTSEKEEVSSAPVAELQEEGVEPEVEEKEKVEEKVEQKVEGMPLPVDEEEEEEPSPIVVEKEEKEQPAPSPEPEPVAEPSPEVERALPASAKAIAEMLDAPLDEPPVDLSPPLPLGAEPTPATAQEPSPAAPPSPPAPAPPAKEDPRLAEITAAYSKLQVLKSSLDRVVSSVLPSVESVDDLESLEGELKSLKNKAETSTAETLTLRTQLAEHQTLLHSLRTDHASSSSTTSSELSTLRSQLSDKDATLLSLTTKLSSLEASQRDQAAHLGKGSEEYEKLKLVAKEEEEKRVKALSLLRALRQKLVKSEKDKEDLVAENAAFKEQAEGAKNDRTRFDQEIVSLRAAQELQLGKVRGSFEREMQAVKQQGEREAAGRKEKWELEVITLKAAWGKEVKEKEARVRELEKTLREVERSRDDVFEKMELRTAEMESARSRQEELEERRGEMEFELREARDRATALMGEVEELRKRGRDESREDMNGRRLLSEAEGRHEAKVRDLEARQRQLEKDRAETEEEMGRNLQERLKEVERMRAQLAQKDVDYAESVHSSRQREARIEEGEMERSELQARLKSVEALLSSVKEDAEKSAKAEAAVREELGDRSQRASELEGRLEEVQAKESSLRSSNKTLRDELRKLQSGVLLSEKQRNPGVGYFSSFNQSTSTVPTSPDLSSSSSPRATPTASLKSPTESNGAAGGVGTGDEALNFEYLRNVILQFLERPEMRPHLISVLGVILHFTPSESRRLAAKAGNS